MKSRQRIAMAIAGAAGVLVLAGYGLYQLGAQQGAHGSGHAAAPAPAASAASLSDPAGWSAAQKEEATRRHLRDGLRAGSVDPVTGRAVLYYQDPMVPGSRFEAPGKSPFMDMMLVPVYAGSGGSDSGGGGGVSISPRMQQNLGVRTAAVTQGRLASQLVASGSIVWNERDQVVVQARASAFVERLYVRATLDPVRATQSGT